MKAIIYTSTLAIAWGLAAPATALDLGVDIGVSGQVDASGGGASAEGRSSARVSASGGGSASGGESGFTAASRASGAGSAAADVSLDAVVAAFATTQAALDAIAAVGAGTTVNVVRIGGMVNAYPSVFAEAVANQAASAEIQAVIAANAGLTADLEGAGIAVRSIVAADIAAGGTLTLYSGG